MTNNILGINIVSQPAQRSVN